MPKEKKIDEKKDLENKSKIDLIYLGSASLIS